MTPSGRTPRNWPPPSGVNPVRTGRTVLGLLCCLPLVKWALPPGLLRSVLFYGGGAALAWLAVRRGGEWPRLRPLFSAPGQGLAGALLGFGLLMALAALTLHWPPLRGGLPAPLHGLVALFDPLELYAALFQGGIPAGLPGLPPVALWTMPLWTVAEEWIFRVVLFWRWLSPRQVESLATRALDRSGVLAVLGMCGKLTAVSLYFASLHWPQPAGMLLVALLGSLALGLLLVWKRNFALIAVLHVLFNWKMALG